MRTAEATLPERPFKAFIQTIPPGLAASRYFKEEVRKLNVLGPSNIINRC